MSNSVLIMIVIAIPLVLFLISFSALNKVVKVSILSITAIFLLFTFIFPSIGSSSVLAEKTEVAIQNVTGEKNVEIHKGQFNRNGNEIIATVKIDDEIYSVIAVSVNEGKNFLDKDKSVVIVNIKKGNVIFYDRETKEW